MKNIVCIALSIFAVGCVGTTDGPPTILFDWSPGSDCPDLTAANREAAVIIRGVDFDGIASDELIVFDCEDGASGVVDLQDGDWDFDLDVVDQYTDSFIEYDCFDTSAGRNPEDCLYYTTTPSRVENVDTFIDYDPDVLVDFAYGYGDFTVDYSIDGLEPSDSQCGGFGDDGATEFRVAMYFYDDRGRVDDLFVCGSNPVVTRDLPLGTYAPLFDLLGADGQPINLDPADLNTPGGEVDLLTHLENVVLDIDIAEF